MSEQVPIAAPPDPRHQIELTPRTLVVLAVILLAAVSLRAYRIGAASMWADELMSLAQATGHTAAQFDEPKDQLVAPGCDLTGMRGRHSWGDLRRTLLVDTHPPLYLSMLRVWRLTFGEGDVAARFGIDFDDMEVLVELLAVVTRDEDVELLHAGALIASAFRSACGLSLLEPTPRRFA